MPLFWNGWKYHKFPMADLQQITHGYFQEFNSKQNLTEISPTILKIWGLCSVCYRNHRFVCPNFTVSIKTEFVSFYLIFLNWCRTYDSFQLHPLSERNQDNDTFVARHIAKVSEEKKDLAKDAVSKDTERGYFLKYLCFEFKHEISDTFMERF